MSIHETIKQRGSRYGAIETVSEINYQLMEVIEKSPNYDALTATHKMSLFMIFHKIARMTCGEINYEDNPHDIAGYATLLENYMKEQNNENV